MASQMLSVKILNLHTWLALTLEKRMSKKRFIVGTLLAIPMIPVMFVGAVYEWVKAYFIAGQEIAKVGVEWLDSKLD
jgi:hypothetical protein